MCVYLGTPLHHSSTDTISLQYLRSSIIINDYMANNILEICITQQGHQNNPNVNKFTDIKYSTGNVREYNLILIAQSC